ncbi:MAG: hypothetical protein J2P54_10255, partial [Bradyrhizobiaceae bacterium]|nr:hypothetical protein [Bradyrhizobiaceae bacterium]
MPDRERNNVRVVCNLPCLRAKGPRTLENGSRLLSAAGYPTVFNLRLDTHVLKQRAFLFVPP